MARIIRCDRCLAEVPKVKQYRLDISDSNGRQKFYADLCVTCANEIRLQLEVPSPAKP